MSQADFEKAYTEAVDLLAHAEESNRLLTERLQEYEIREAAVMKVAHQLFPMQAQRSSYMDAVESIRDILDRPVGASQDERPPASPGVPT